MRNLGIGLRLTRGGGVSASFIVSIGSGPFTTGATLTATVDGVENGQSVTWVFQDDGVDIAGSGGAGVWPQSIDYTAAIGTDGIADASSIRCVITVDGGDPINSGSRAITYAAPVNTVAPAVTGNTSLGDTLTTTDGTWTGASISYSYQWQRNGADISGETSNTYTIVAGDSADAIRCVVTAANSGGGVDANSNAVTVDTFSAPVITGVPTIAGTETEGQTLTATAASVAGGPTPSRTWQWERSGVAIPGATSSTYLLTSDDVGETITVVQTETNGLGVDSAESAATGAIASAPTVPAISGVPTISGTELVGQTLTASAASVTGTPAPTTTWQWERAGTPISGATSATYTLVSADAGQTLTVVQTETNSEGSDTAESSATGTIGSVPAITGIPTISGTETEGETLTASAASVAGVPTPTRTWQWERSGSPISGATSATYVLQAADVGATLTVVQTETNANGSDTAESSATGTISAVASNTITIDTASYTRGTAGVAPDLATTVSSTGTTTGNYTLFWATRSTGTALSKTNIENGTGDALDNGSIVAAALADLDGTLDLSTSLTSGAIDLFVRDSSGSPVESDVVSETGVTYDAVAPDFTSATIEDASASTLTLVLDKDSYVAAGETLAIGDFTFGGTLAAKLSGGSVARTNATTYTFTLTSAAVNGETGTIALSAGTLVGIDAEDVSFAAQSITNNVSGATFAPAFDSWVLNDFDVEGSANSEHTFSPTVSATGDVLVFITGVQQDATTITGATIGGNTLTAVQSAVSGDGNIIWVGKGTMSGATGSDVVCTTDSGSFNSFFESACAVIDIDGAAASATDSALVTGADDTAASDVSVNTSAGDAVIAFWHGRRFSGGVDVTWVGTTSVQEDNGTSVSSQAWQVAIETGVTAATPRTVTATPVSTQARACGAVSIGAA